jgi:phospholipase/carboxylesterase
MRRLAIVVGICAVATAACGGSDAPMDTRGATTADDQRPPDRGRLTARPGPGGGNCGPGEHELRLGGGRTALMRVAPGSRDGRKALLVVLHGAGSGGSGGGLYAFRGAWQERGLVMVAPAAQGSTWSVLTGPDTDLRYVDRALQRAFARCRVNPRLVGVGGFSDGATYALTLGITNGDLFRAVLALSPGGLVADRTVGRPRIFIAHGTRDDVLPMDRTSDLAVRDLRQAGYSVTYRRFRGGHEARPAISREAVRWFLRRR